jgi:hypothetical protein
MRNFSERVVRDLGAIRIENLVGTESPTNRIGLYPEDYDTVAGLFLCKKHEIPQQTQGGMQYAKKESNP